jgi:hypothetical protein
MNMYDMPEPIRALLALITSQEDWATPEPLLQPMPAVPQLAPNMLPKVLSDVVFDEAERMSCPPDYIAASLVVALGAVVGASAAVRPKRNDRWIVMANLWGAVIGLPGSKKSAAINAGLKNVYRMNSQAQDQHRQMVSMAEMQKQATTMQIKAVERKIKLEVSNLKKTGAAHSDKEGGGQ